MLASLLFPYDDDAPSLLPAWLEELASQDVMQMYMVAGSSYIQIKKWSAHQRIDKPSESKIPEFLESSRILANPRVALPVGRERKGKEGKGEERKESTRERASASPPDPLPEVPGLDDFSWGRWQEYRKQIGKPLKAASLQAARQELAKFGAQQQAVVQQSIAQGWQGLFQIKKITKGRHEETEEERIADRNRRFAEASALLDGRKQAPEVTTLEIGND